MAGPIPAASGRIFISYRREETAYPAAWLYDRLADHFGSDQVFKDVDSIQLGDDFVEVITRAVGSCDVLLALIGSSWLTVTDEHGRRRLDNPDDFIRLEIEAALTRQVRVIPILVEGARMPRADELPPSMAKLVRRQALELSPSRFEFDTNRLLKVLDMTLAELRTAQQDAAPKVVPAGNAPGPGTTADGARPPPDRGLPPEGPSRRRPARTRVLAGVGAGVVLLLVVGVVVANSRTTPSPGGNAGAGRAVEVDATPVTSGDGIRLTGLRVSPSERPSEGDTMTISYSLTNVGDQPLQLAITFVGARNQAGDHKDSEETNQGRAISPGETIDAQGRILFDSPGTWHLWPCYELSDGRSCPDEWQAFPVLVE